jgi:hypothetical protein
MHLGAGAGMRDERNRRRRRRGEERGKMKEER